MLPPGEVADRGHPSLSWYGHLRVGEVAGFLPVALLRHLHENQRYPAVMWDHGGVG